MEEVLKGLQGKSLTKKKFFDFLADIDLAGLCGERGAIDALPIALAAPIEKKKPEEIKCKACSKSFATDESLKRHHDKTPVCINWLSLPQNTNIVQLPKGLHLIVDELLEKSVSANGKLQCKFCNSTFINKGNLHKHFNTSNVCNRLAYQDFKRLFDSL